MPNISVRKLTLCYLLRSNFKRKNNIEEKILGVANFFGETLEKRVSCFG